VFVKLPAAVFNFLGVRYGVHAAAAAAWFHTGHNYIGTEHILLGLLREGEGVAARVLETLGADPSKIRTQVGTWGPRQQGCSSLASRAPAGSCGQGSPAVALRPGWCCQQ
jgi:hypothetical protein